MCRLQLKWDLNLQFSYLETYARFPLHPRICLLSRNFIHVHGAGQVKRRVLSKHSNCANTKYADVACFISLKFTVKCTKMNIFAMI